MEEENQSKHRCNICGNFKAFYIMKDSCFEKTGCGLCTKSNQIKDHYETCEQWRFKARRRYGVMRTTMRALHEMTVQLGAISQILQEVNDEDDKSRG